MSKKKINWVKTISRREAIIRSELIVRGAALNIPCITNTQCNNFLFVLQKGQGSAYFDEDQIKEMGKALAKRIAKNPEVVSKHIQGLQQASEELVEVAEAESKGNLERLSLKNLKQRFEEFVEAHLKFSPYMMTPFAVEKICYKKVKEALARFKDTDKLLEELLVPSELPAVILEQRELAELAQKIKQKKIKNYQPLLEKHWQKYCWLSVYSPTDKPYNLSYFRGRLEGLLQTNILSKQIDEALSKVQAAEEKLEELKLHSETVQLIELLRQYVFLRTYRVEMLCRAYHLVRPVFTEIAKRADLQLSDLAVLNLNEILNFLEGEKLPPEKELSRRKGRYAYLMRNGKLGFYVGKQVDKMLEEELSGGRAGLGEIKELVGSVACRGYAKGRVRLATKDNISSFQKGEILVTTMTSPDFTLAMQKAVAVVTDEGGVLCHAAIVSREFGIPCVIGTERATKVLKDGDLVEVDADKGIVRKLEK